MTTQQQPSKALNTGLWAAQFILAIFLLMGAIMKFMPIETIAEMMPWTGEIPPSFVRILGLIDLVGALGLVLPGIFRFKYNLTWWAAAGVIGLMICATVFHILRGEASVIGFNVFMMIIAGLIVWGRRKSYSDRF